MQTPVENLLMTIESFNKQFQSGEKEREAVKWGWEQEMGNTTFNVVNAYTRGAEYEGLSAEARYRLQKIGGMVLGMVKQSCNNDWEASQRTCYKCGFSLPAE